jgi:23S rRNA pseudouridine1911/1915/1917 synthase
MEPKIIFEDERILVLNKPPGLVVNRAQSVKQSTLQEWVEQYLQSDAGYQADFRQDASFAERSGMVHRLDKDTSGVIVFAKRAAVMQELLQQFKSRQVEKTYWALVHGQLSDKKGIISAPIERHPQRRDIFAVTETGRPSVTEFSVQQEFLPLPEEKLRAWAREQGREREYKNLRKSIQLYEGGFSLLELKPKTGRTHQLRVHLKFVHHPIVGDERYVGEKRWKLDQLWCNRQWLHAKKLKLPGYEEFEANLASDLQNATQLLK